MNKQENNFVFLKNWLFKALVITITPFIIGIIDNYGDWKNENGSWNNVLYNGKIFVIFLTVIYIIYIIFLAYSEKKEQKNKQDINALNKQIETLNLYVDTYKEVFDSLNSLMNISQRDINDLSKKIVQTSDLELLNWNFESVSNYICRDLVNVLSKISKSGNDITVNIYIKFKKKIGRTNKEYIKMIAHAGGTNSEPSILYTDILINKKKDWQYAKLFLENNPKIVIYPTEEEIKKHFHFNSNFNNYSGEYTQYIGIPISCSSGNIISSLEIISHHGTIIADTKDDLLDLTNKYILVYRNYALLCHKIEKGLRAKRVSLENEVKMNEK